MDVLYLHQHNVGFTKWKKNLWTFMIVNPWGEVIAEADEKTSNIYALIETL